MFVEFCDDRGIDNLRKYRDETWTEYLTRLRDSAELKGIPESLILKKLRAEKSPRELQTLFFAIGADMNAIISRVREWEPLLTNMTKNNIVIKQKKTFQRSHPR
ncbi:hypothetical protein CDIK_2426 [Cucumispora dikerogammari]|nr:hypothetical protein CDIK_2426 [Cucumispora dikerogammari]